MMKCVKFISLIVATTFVVTMGITLSAMKSELKSSLEKYNDNPMLKELVEKIVDPENYSSESILNAINQLKEKKFQYDKDILPQISSYYEELNKKLEIQELSKQGKTYLEVIKNTMWNYSIGWLSGSEQHNEESKETVENRISKNNLIKQRLDNLIQEETKYFKGPSNDGSNQDLNPGEFSSIGLSDSGGQFDCCGLFKSKVKNFKENMQDGLAECSENCLNPCCENMGELFSKIFKIIYDGVRCSCSTLGYIACCDCIPCPKGPLQILFDIDLDDAEPEELEKVAAFLTLVNCCGCLTLDIKNLGRAARKKRAEKNIGRCLANICCDDRYDSD